MSLTDIYIGGKLCDDFPLNVSLYRRKAAFPGSLTDLHRFRKTAHGHDGSSRIVMVRKTDQRTFASVENGKVSQGIDSAKSALISFWDCFENLLSTFYHCERDMETD